MNTKIDRAILGLDARLSELLEERMRVWLRLQEASPENGESALLEIDMHKIEDEISEVRGDLSRLDNDDDWRRES